MYDKCYFCLDQLPKLKKESTASFFVNFGGAGVQKSRPTLLYELTYQPKLNNFKYFLKHGSVTLSLFFALIDVSSITQCIFYPLQDERNCWNLGTNPYTQQFRINMIMIINPLFA